MAWIRIDGTGKVLTWEEEAAGFFDREVDGPHEWSLQELLDEETARALEEALRPEERDSSASHLVKAILEGSGRRPQDGSFPLALTLVPCRRREGEDAEFVVLLQDLSIRGEMESRLFLLESAANLMDEALVVTGGQTTDLGPPILYCNRAFASLFGSFPETLTGQRIRRVLGATLWGRLLPLVSAGLESGEPLSGEVVLSSPERGEILLEWEIEPVRESTGRISHFLSVLREVNGLRDPERDRRDGFGLDPTTGLPTRELFLNRLSRSVGWAEESRAYTFAVLCLELVGLHQIRLTLGPAIAVQVLKAAGWRLRRALRPADLVARMGEERLMVLLEHPGPPHQIDRVLERTRRELASPYTVAGSTFALATATGIAFSASGYRLPEEVIREAGRALDRARSQGRSDGGHAVADVERYRSSRQRAEQIAQLKSGVANGRQGRLDLVYHPILDLESGRPLALESLLRWREPDQSLLPAQRVLPLLEEAGLLRALDRHVLRKAAAQVVAWKAQLPGVLAPVTVNLAPNALRDPEFHQEVREILDANGLNGTDLAFEIPERAIRDDPEVVRTALRRLREPGTELWMDGFATEGAPLLRLGDLPFRTVKIHYPLMREAKEENGKGRQRALGGLLSFTRALDLEAVATGIESEAQLEEARALGFRFGQGFLLADLLDGEEVATYLKEATPA